MDDIQRHNEIGLAMNYLSEGALRTRQMAWYFRNLPDAVVREFGLADRIIDILDLLNDVDTLACAMQTDIADKLNKLNTPQQ